MYCEFSEMQFAFGILNELVTYYFKSKNGWSAPILPTQREEMQLGYDCKIQNSVRAILFQFKVPEVKTTERAKYWHDFNEPYYIFKIWPDNKSPQHNKLRKLAKDPHYGVYYCAPCFHTQAEFDNNYKKNIIANHSIYIPCETLMEISGDDKHDIIYTTTPTLIRCRMHSETQEVAILNLEELIGYSKSIKEYENISECLEKIADVFSIDELSSIEGDMAKLEFVTKYLLLKENLCMVLL